MWSSSLGNLAPDLTSHRNPTPTTNPNPAQAEIGKSTQLKHAADRAAVEARSAGSSRRPLRPLLCLRLSHRPPSQPLLTAGGSTTRLVTAAPVTLTSYANFWSQCDGPAQGAGRARHDVLGDGRLFRQDLHQRGAAPYNILYQYTYIFNEIA